MNAYKDAKIKDDEKFLKIVNEKTLNKDLIIASAAAAAAGFNFGHALSSRRAEQKVQEIFKRQNTQEPPTAS